MDVQAQLAEMRQRLDAIEQRLTLRVPHELAGKPVSAIIADVAGALDIAPERILADDRRKVAFRARAAVVWVALMATPLDQTRIAGILNRDPSTISAAAARARDLRDADPTFRALTDRLLDAALARKQS